MAKYKNSKREDKNPEKNAESAPKTENITLTSDQLQQMFESERNRLQGFEQTIASIKSYISENLSALEAVKALIAGSEESTIMAALGGDLYVESTVQKKNKLKKLVAGKAIVEISLDDAKELLDKRAEELSKTYNRTMQEQQQLIAKINQLANIMNQGQRAARRQYTKDHAQAETQ